MPRIRTRECAQARRSPARRLLATPHKADRLPVIARMTEAAPAGPSAVHPGQPNAGDRRSCPSNSCATFTASWPVSASTKPECVFARVWTRRARQAAWARFNSARYANGRRWSKDNRCRSAQSWLAFCTHCQIATGVLRPSTTARYPRRSRVPRIATASIRGQALLCPTRGP